MKVRALQDCFVGAMLHRVGDVYDVPRGTALRTGKLAPVMERVKAGTRVGKAPYPPPAVEDPELESVEEIEVDESNPEDDAA